MKTKFIYPLLLSLITIPAIAQNESNALQFSQNYTSGTARSLSMGGAFGALGGDASSLSINPAGLGVYRKSEFTFTMGVNADKAESSYRGLSSQEYKNKFNLSNLAYIGTFNTNREEGWVGASFGIAYNRLNDFNRTSLIVGKNQKSSLLDNFASYANWEKDANGNFQLNPYWPKNLNTYYEGLAFYDHALIDTIPGSGEYVNVVNYSNYGQSMRKVINTKGGLGEYAFSFGANLSHKFYFGTTLGVQSLNYEEVKSHREYVEGVSLGNFDNFNFTEHFNAYGSGVNLKFGVIARPIDFLRIGLAVHTPTYFRLKSEFYTSLSSRYTTDTKDIFTSTEIYSNDYKLKTPMKAIGSLAFVFSDFGILSMDYEYVDYSKANLKPTDPENSNDDFSNTNSNISNYFKQTSNLKIGFEGKLGPIAGRLGYAIYGNPYEKGQISDNYKYQSYSAGIGVRGKAIFFDLAYVLNVSQDSHLLYEYMMRDNSGNPKGYAQEIADMKYTNSKIMATLGFRF